MADIAAIYHWTPDYLNGLSLIEISAEHTRAIKRYNLMNGIKD